QMPLVGFGTWQIKGDDAVRAVSVALEAGYRHLDTATVYGNEAKVGQGLAQSGVARDDVFVTTKCPPSNVGQGLDTLRRRLVNLGIADRLDRTPAQVIIRWHVQHGIVVIPKSVDPDRIRSNADVASFVLTGDDMAALDALGSATG